VLRETTAPVLVTPAHDPGPIRVEDGKQLIGRIIVPVDLSAASAHQIEVARRIAGALAVPLILVHVIEPLRSRFAARSHMAGIEGDRRAVAEDALQELLVTPACPGPAEALVACGDPAEEIAKVARDRQAGLVVMGLHGSPLLGPRMGSVTYRLLCLCPTLVLALPPKRAEVVTTALACEVATMPALSPL